MTDKNLSQPTKSNNYLKNSLAIAVTVLVLLIAVAIFAREEVIDGQLEPDRISDTEAWEQLFLLLRDDKDHMQGTDLPPSRWTLEFQESWLAESGLEQAECREVIRAANRYQADEEVKKIERDILETNNKGRDDKKIDQFTKLKKVHLYGHVMEMDISPESKDKMQRFIKQGTVTTQQGLMRSLVPVLFAQGGMTGSVIRTLVLSRPVNSRWIAVRGAANTNGAFGHTTKITVKAISPSNRTVTAYSNTAYSVTATAYIDLCSVTICEDGWYSSSLLGNIFCRYGGSFPAYSQAPAKSEMKKFITLDVVRWTGSNAYNAATITTMARQNATAWLRAQIRKSSNCSVVNVASEGVIGHDLGMKINTESSPVKQTITFPPSQYFAEGFWKVTTYPDNPVAGQINGGVAIASYAECPNVEWNKSASVKVQ